MAWFAVIDESSGALVSVGTVVADPLPKGLSAIALTQERPTGAWDAALRAFVAVEAPGAWEIKRLSFALRFSQQERIDIEVASLDQSTDAKASRDQRDQIQSRMLAAAIRDSRRLIGDGERVDLRAQTTRDSVTILEKFGLLGVGRSAQILDTEPTPEEIIRG